MHLQDQLREVCESRIRRGTATIGSIAIHAQLSASHVSAFVRHHKDLSADAFERVMRVVGFEAQLFPAVRRPAAAGMPSGSAAVPRRCRPDPAPNSRQPKAAAHRAPSRGRNPKLPVLTSEEP
jgi:hypothetical protein